MSEDDPSKYLEKMKLIQEKIKIFIEEEANSDEHFQTLEEIFKTTKIKDNRFEFLSLLHLIVKIANNYHRSYNFFNKIDRILQYFQQDIQKQFSNSQIFNIFKSNKRILLFLTENRIMIFDEYIVKKISTTPKFIEAKYPQYFQPEIQPFINEKWFPKYDPNDNELKKNGWVKEIKKELPDNFYEKRKVGENDSQICELIRKDMIAEFVTYVTINGVSLNAKIQPSIYETNPFLLKRQIESTQNLIEYAVFFGSIQIFKYLLFNYVELTPSLWLFAIHGQNSQVIRSLESNHVELEDESYKQVFYESIKCHHNDIANNFIDNFLQNDEEKSHDSIYQFLKYYNFAFLEKDLVNESSFFNLCKYDYCEIVDSLLKSKDIDINNKYILRYFSIKIS